MRRLVSLTNLILILSTSAILAGCSNKKYEPTELGSAGILSGRTVVVSIFTDDKYTSWDDDNSLMDDSLTYLGIACEWIEGKASEYEAEAEFVYDWNENKDLKYDAHINVNLTEDSIEDRRKCCNLIDELVDSAKLVKKYDADNIIYIMYVNTPKDNSVTSSTFCYYDGMNPSYEICNMLMTADGMTECPAAFAHEILHTFGAPDLYAVDTANNNYGITEEYVEALESNNSNDIMFTTFDADSGKTYYDRIVNDFTELDAYYVGLTDHSSEAEMWELLPSQHKIEE